MPVCPGMLVESAPGVGECDRGIGCVAAYLHDDDYEAFREEHDRITSRWLVESGGDEL